ncbi:MAG: hypothetical protein Q8P26_02215 [Candidatus Levybacteria bacterium]|nr:hypothetical protein [Candidatus Levybacteria bacterium]
MNDVIEGTITKSYQELSKEKVISFSFPVKGYEKTASLFLVMKNIYKKSFIHDFYKILTSKVE